MGVVQIRLPEELSSLIARQVEAGRAESTEAYLAEAKAGIRDAEAGRYTTVSGPEDADALEQRIIARLHARLASDGG